MDLKFDISTHEIVIENGDFVIETNPSNQNSYILLVGKNFCSLFPIMGVGILGVMNSAISTIHQYMNRWKGQAISDGAKSASYQLDENNKINASANYV